MGWNTVDFVHPAPVRTPRGERRGGSVFLFVHSYRVETPDVELIWGETTYGPDRFVSAIRRGRCYATQFHPEKSQRVGLELYERFLETL